MSHEHGFGIVDEIVEQMDREKRVKMYQRTHTSCHKCSIAERKVKILTGNEIPYTTPEITAVYDFEYICADIHDDKHINLACTQGNKVAEETHCINCKHCDKKILGSYTYQVRRQSPCTISQSLVHCKLKANKRKATEYHMPYFSCEHFAKKD